MTFCLNEARLDNNAPEIPVLLEMHAHTKEHSPCSKISAVDLVRAVSEAGLDGVIMTDHHHVWSELELFALRAKACVSQKFRLFSGQEVTTSDAGDVLVYGPQVSIGPGIRLEDLRRNHPDAALVLAHPWRGQARPGTVQLFDPNIDAIEVLNKHHGFRRNRMALREWRTWGFVATAGTDVHDGRVGTFPTRFESHVSSMQDVVEEIQTGTCRPFFRRSHPWVEK
jgi:3',5'-nucleoside bisphosphate phosphatase